MNFSEWREVELEEVIELVIDYRGKTPKKLGGDWSQVGFRALSAKNIKTGTIVQEDAIRYLDSNLYTKWMKEEVNRGDILMTSEAPFGELLHWDSDEKIVLSQRLFCLRTNKKVDSKYLYYYMTTNRFQKELDARATGTTVRGLRQPQLLKCKIEYPPIKDQKAIAHILSTLDDKIEVNNQINKTLENMAQAIFKQWFVDFEFPNEDGEPYRSSGGEMVESELGMIPKGWEVKKVEQVTKIIRGASPRPIQDFIRDEGIPWVKISDASSSNTRFISSTKEFIKEEGRKKSREVKVGTLILSNSATPGIPMIMKIDACVHDGWLIFDEFREVTKEYMFHFLTENRIGILSLSNGSVFRNLKTDILKNYKIIIPSRDVVARVDNIFKSINNSIDNIENQITTLTKIRDGLLTKLMSGEIRVPLDEEGDVS